jgi:protein phosphatase
MRDVTKPAYDLSRLRTLGILPADDRPPFDIIGDVHGCIDELRNLLDQLGYVPANEGYTHPMGRRVVFVGDLVDRGPSSVPVLEIALAMHANGIGLLVLGNHDARFLRWLCGRNVRTAYGLAQTIAELHALPDHTREALQRKIRRLFDETPGYLILNEGQLIVTHGGIRDTMIGTWNGETAFYCLYGEVEGYSPSGKPLRRDWAASRHVTVCTDESQLLQAEALPKQSPYIVYGHNVVQELAWVNRTLDLDTGCVYGRYLSALRYPELELIQVSAQRAYAHQS